MFYIKAHNLDFTNWLRLENFAKVGIMGRQNRWVPEEFNYDFRIVTDFGFWKKHAANCYKRSFGFKLAITKGPHEKLNSNGGNLSAFH